jgi:uncharacterized protein
VRAAGHAGLVPAHPKLVIAGAGGVIGRALLSAAEGRFERVVLTRGGTDPPGVASVRWSPEAAERGDEAELERLAAALDGAAAIVNLAGSSIADGRLGDDHLRRLRASRVQAAATLIEAARRASDPPPVWFQASGADGYGDRGEEELDEGAPLVGDAPLVELVRVWESSAEPARAFARVVIGRIGVVLASDARAWQRLLLPIRLFVGGPFGSGRQYFPWILHHDLARSILFLIDSNDADGPYNLVARPTRQIELTRAAARRLRRPALIPAPACALRLALGRVADALLLSSRRVVPARLLEGGFRHDAWTPEEAARRLLP